MAGGGSADPHIWVPLTAASTYSRLREQEAAAARRHTEQKEQEAEKAKPLVIVAGLSKPGIKSLVPLNYQGHRLGTGQPVAKK
mmetsp:Transcript_95836/g.172889  ORF Transcript_95836/g.172889 Transcript_95836/m.172889 type:complete len:83 (-) Transcript_95836:78-326(-)